MSAGATWDDPSDDALFEPLSDIERGEEQFMVVARTADLCRRTYAQEVRTDKGAGSPSVATVQRWPRATLEPC